MKTTRLSRLLGIVYRSELQEIILFVKNDWGELKDNQTWNDTKTEESARKILKKQKFEQAKVSLLELIKTHPYGYINGLSKTQGSALFNLLNFFYSFEHGSDNKLEQESCLNRIIEFIESGMPLPDVIPKMREEIDKEPDIYLNISENGAKKLAENIFSQIKVDLTHSLPSGFQIRENAVNHELTKLILDRVPRNRLIENLMKEINSNPLDYVVVPPPKDRGPVDYAQRS